MRFFFFRESHGFASARGTVLLLRESRPCLSKVMFLLLREARLCFRESHGRASRERKKNVILFFSFREHGFASARGTGVLSRESRPCLFGNEKNVFSFLFFLPRGSRFYLREKRHVCDFVRGTGVPLSEREKPVLPVRFFRPIFFIKKNSSKPINMGSSLEDLNARNQIVKAV